jgi:hypothetical protein
MLKKKIFYILVSFFIFLPFFYDIFFEWHYNWTIGAVFLAVGIAGLVITIIISYFSFEEFKTPNVLLCYALALAFICALSADRLATFVYFKLNVSHLNEVVDEFKKNPELKKFRVTTDYSIEYNNEELKYSALKSDKLEDYLSQRNIDTKLFLKLEDLTEKLDMLSIRKEDDGSIIFLNDGFINGSEGLIFSNLPEDSKRDYFFKPVLFKVSENWYRWHSR